MDKAKLIDLGIEVLNDADLSKIEDIAVESGTYEDGRKYTTISIEYLHEQIIYADDKEVIK